MVKKQNKTNNNKIFKRAAIWYGIIAIGTIFTLLLSISTGTYEEIYNYEGTNLILNTLDFISIFVTIALPYLYIKRSVWSYRLTYVFITSASILEIAQLIYALFNNSLSISKVADQLNITPNLVLLSFIIMLVITLIHVYLPTETRKVLNSKIK